MGGALVNGEPHHLYIAHIFSGCHRDIVHNLFPGSLKAISDIMTPVGKGCAT